jgi:excisionase family DNA binding protein
MTDDFLSVQQLADWLGVPRRTIDGWRYRGVGPRGYRIGRHVRYRRAEVEAWLSERRDPAPLRVIPRSSWTGDP